MEDEIIEVPEAAKILKVEESTVRYFARRKQIPSRKAGAKVYQFRRADVEAFALKPRKPGNPGKAGRTLKKVRFPDELFAEFKGELKLTGKEQDDALAEALQAWIDDQRRQRRKKK